MKEDEIRWDNRYREKRFPDDAADLVKDFWQLAEPGPALDIAAGNGRNAAFLSEHQFAVDAVDISGVALDLIRSKQQGIRCVQADLDTYQPEPDAYNLIVNINYLNRRLFPHMVRSLRINGVLIFRAFLASRQQYDTRSHGNPAHYLQPNELLRAFLSLHIVYYREHEIHRPQGEQRAVASLVARKS